MSAKMDLARRIITDFHSSEAAEEARRHFDSVVRQKEAPDDMPEHVAGAGSVALSRLIADAKLAGSRNEARRLIQQGAVSIDGQKVSEDREVTGPAAVVLKVGKRRFARVTFG